MNFPELKTFALDNLPELDAGELAQPWDDNPDVGGSEVDIARKLEGDRTHIRSAAARSFADYRSNPDAFRHLATLPGPGQSLHGIISGRYALWELVPAIIERTGNYVDDLHLATLSFSQANAAEILDLFDRAHIKRISLLVSHYFKATSPQIYDALVPKLLERGQTVLAMRTHCKIILMSMSDGTKYVAESSANLRSCKNIEQFVLTNCPDLYGFHRGWMGEVFRASP